jgi:hypothetical protein
MPGYKAPGKSANEGAAGVARARDMRNIALDAHVRDLRRGEPQLLVIGSACGNQQVAVARDPQRPGGMTEPRERWHREVARRPDPRRELVRRGAIPNASRWLEETDADHRIHDPRCEERQCGANDDAPGQPACAKEKVRCGAAENNPDDKLRRERFQSLLLADAAQHIGVPTTHFQIGGLLGRM